MGRGTFHGSSSRVFSAIDTLFPGNESINIISLLPPLKRLGPHQLTESSHSLYQCNQSPLEGCKGPDSSNIVCSSQWQVCNKYIRLRLKGQWDIQQDQLGTDVQFVLSCVLL